MKPLIAGLFENAADRSVERVAVVRIDVLTLQAKVDVNDVSLLFHSRNRHDLAS
jgi:hypothetical protein